MHTKTSALHMNTYLLRFEEPYSAYDWLVPVTFGHLVGQDEYVERFLVKPVRSRVAWAIPRKRRLNWEG